MAFAPSEGKRRSGTPGRGNTRPTERSAPDQKDDRTMLTLTHTTAGLAAHAAASRPHAVAPACAMPWYGNAEKRFVGFVSTDHITRTRRPEGVPR